MRASAIIIALHGISAISVSGLSTPCFNGVCFYDIPSSSDSMSGKVMIVRPILLPTVGRVSYVLSCRRVPLA